MGLSGRERRKGRSEREGDCRRPRTGLAIQVSAISMAVNLLLCLLKLCSGILGHSDALISDGIHSATDVLVTLIVLAGAGLSAEKPDSRHPYGHERLECVAAALLAAVLAGTAFGIGAEGISGVLQKKTAASEPGLLPLTVSVVAIIIKELMFRYTRRAARKIDSGVLMADAWHHRSDALASVGAFGGILGARLGMEAMDSVAAVVISLFILKVAAVIFMDAVEKLTDTACDSKLIEDILCLAQESEGVEGIGGLRTRKFGTRACVDMEILADGNLSLTEAYKIIRKLQEKVETNFPVVKYCMVQITPLQSEKKS